MTSYGERKTRVWWDGDEVAFVRWTNCSLVFSWLEPTVTATQMPRGAVIRLMEKGVLYVEGPMPDWIPAEFRQEPAKPAFEPIERHAEPCESVSAIDEPPVSPHDTQPLEPIEKAKSKRPDLARAIGRLIRKLSGGESSPAPEPVPSPAPDFRTGATAGLDGDHRSERRAQPASH